MRIKFIAYGTVGLYYEYVKAATYAACHVLLVDVEYCVDHYRVMQTSRCQFAPLVLMKLLSLTKSSC